MKQQNLEVNLNFGKSEPRLQIPPWPHGVIEKRNGFYQTATHSFDQGDGY
jgi:hypothetical protein